MAAAGGAAAAAAGDAAALRRAQRKLFWRVTVLFALVVVFNFLDKGNLAFASLQMTKQLGFSPAVYGLGAGLLFAGYAAFMVPANMLLPLVGGPRWLALLCVAWGAVATASAGIRDQASFLALRTLLGVTEAGVVPAILFFLTRFYSQSRLTVPYTAVVLGQTIAQVIGAPLAAAILQLDGRAGIEGWRWLFLLEGIPSVLMAVPMWRLPTTIDECSYLTAEEKAAAKAALVTPECGGESGAPNGVAAAPSGTTEGNGAGGAAPAAPADVEAGSADAAPRGARAAPSPAGAPPAAAGAADERAGCAAGAGAAFAELWRVLRLPVVICGSFWSLLFGMSTQAFNYWTPMIVSSLLDSGLLGGPLAAGAPGSPPPAGAPAAAGAGAGGGGGASQKQNATLSVLLSTVPFLCAALLQAAVGWHSQRTGERRMHTSGAFLLSAACMLLLPLPMMRGAPRAAFGLLVVAAAAAFAGTGPNLSWKNSMLSPDTRLVGMPVMIAITALGGFIGPFAMGALKTASGQFYSSFWLLGGSMLAAAAMVQAFPARWAAEGSEEWARARAACERRGGAAAKA